MKSDKDEVVQARAAAALGSLVRSAGGVKSAGVPAVDDLVAQFRLYDAKSTRSDKGWGWREVGNALRMAGKEGEAALDALMGDTSNEHLAELAWRVVHLAQQDNFLFITEEQAHQAHAKHPLLRFDTNDASTWGARR